MNKKSIEDKIMSLEKELIFLEKKRKELYNLKYNYSQELINIKKKKRSNWKYNWLQ